MTRVTLSLDFISDRSIASSSVHFLYKYHTPSPLISLLSTKMHYQSTSVILVKDHSIQFRCQSSTPFLRSLTNLVNTLFFTSLSYLWTYSFLFSRLYTPVTPSRPVRVLGFVVTCRQCLVRQVISQLSMTGWITRKYTRQVTKTKRVQAKRGVCPLFLVLNK